MPKAKPLPSAEEILDRYAFCFDTGEFKCRKTNMIAGAITKSGTGYRQLYVNSQPYLAHRLAWLLYYKEDPVNFQIDHINGNGLDNSKQNLRKATHAENMRNRRKHKVTTSSPFKGVFFRKDKNRWEARIWFNNKRIRLGMHSTPELAHMAYCKAAAELHGEFARGQ